MADPVEREAAVLPEGMAGSGQRAPQAGAAGDRASGPRVTGGLKERSGSPPEDGGSGGLKERSGSPPEHRG
jgi:hypothetical protein